MKQLVKFSLIGVIGFFIDGYTLIYLFNELDLNIVISRVISFSFAVLVTWFLNRTLTFTRNKQSKKIEYSKYLVVQVFGALINFSIFLSLIYIFKSLENMLLVPLGLGAIVSLFFNFYFTKVKVYNND